MKRVTSAATGGAIVRPRGLLVKIVVVAAHTRVPNYCVE